MFLLRRHCSWRTETREGKLKKKNERVLMGSSIHSNFLTIQSVHETHSLSNLWWWNNSDSRATWLTILYTLWHPVNPSIKSAVKKLQWNTERMQSIRALFSQGNQLSLVLYIICRNFNFCSFAIKATGVVCRGMQGERRASVTMKR